MNEKNLTKKRIFEHLQKEAVSQENQVRRIVENIRFNESEINDFILNRLKVDEDLKTQNDLERFKCEEISRYFYESVNKEGEIKQRELDLCAHFEIEGTKQLDFHLTLLGDIKRTDKYKWLFSADITTDEAEYEKLDFPFIELNRPHDLYNIGIESFFTLDKMPVFEKTKPYASVLIPFYKRGEVIKNDRKNNPRNFCEQIISGVESYYWKIKNLILDKKTSKVIYHIIIPIMVTSSNYYYCKNIPPSSEDELFEIEWALYLFNPSTPSMLNQWRIPILVTTQSSLEQTLKNLFLAFKFECWHILRTMMK